MSKTTAVNAIPYPEATDNPDGPTQIKALAELLDTLKWGSLNLRPTVGLVQASSQLVVTGSYADISGTTLELTPAVDSLLEITAHFRFQIFPQTSSDATVTGTIRLDSTDQTRVAVVDLSTNTNDTFTGMISQSYLLSLKGGEKHTIKMRGKGAGPTGEDKFLGIDTGYLYKLYAA